MNPEIKKQWVNALRSGKYEQGQGYLRTADDKFCCLGVLCDIVAPDYWEPKAVKRYENGRNIEIHVFSLDDNYLGLSDAMQDSTGLKEAEPFVTRNGEKESLTNFNDHKGYDFEMLADLIESGL